MWKAEATLHDIQPERREGRMAHSRLTTRGKKEEIEQLPAAGRVDDRAPLHANPVISSVLIRSAFLARLKPDHVLPAAAVSSSG